MIGEKLYELTANWRVVEYGNTSDGTRYDYHLEGKATGKISGKLEGVDYATIGRDNNATQHVHETITLDDGVCISVTRQGKAVPALEGQYKVLGFATFATGASNYEWLNSTVAAIEGIGKPSKPNLSLTAYLWEMF